MYEGRNARYFYQISDRISGEILKEGYVTVGSKAECEEAARLIKMDLRQELGLSAARDEDRERLKVYLKAAPEEPKPQKTMEQIRQLTGMNRAAFSRAYGIPYRTIDDWEHGRRQPPEWLAGILEKAIMFDLEEEKKMTRYRVKDEFADSWYGGDTDLDYIEECQTNGIPQEDIDHMVREYGPEILDQLEEI